MNKNTGQYNIEYQNSPCFWGKEPAKFVKLIPKYINKAGNVLDIGAGEGKNSFFLASLGHHVTAVEISPFAIKNFIHRLIQEQKKLPNENLENIQLVMGDFDDFSSHHKYDIIVSYGFLHCSKSIEKLEEAVKKTKNLTKKGGINVVCTFTDDLPIPEIQKYLTPTLLSADKIKKLYDDWAIIKYENGVTEHSHPTSKTVHKHSVCRLIAKKI